MSLTEINLASDPSGLKQRLSKALLDFSSQLSSVKFSGALVQVQLAPWPSGFSATDSVAWPLFFVASLTGHTLWGPSHALLTSASFSQVWLPDRSPDGTDFLTTQVDS